MRRRKPSTPKAFASRPLNKAGAQLESRIGIAIAFVLLFAVLIPGCLSISVFSFSANPVDVMIGAVPQDKPTRSATRYETVIATLVGLMALCVSGYTAFMQRQQVRAMVWPILEFDSSNDPNIHWTLTNKGVGPAIVRHVVVKVDGQPVRDWIEAFGKLVGAGEPHYSESDMSGRVLSAGESITVFTPWGPDNKPINYDRSNPLYMQMNNDRARMEAEICYCSTLGDCWILRGGGKTANITIPTRGCPTPSATSFRQ